MSPWEACNTIPNTTKQAAARIGSFFNGDPLNLKGLVFLNMAQFKAAFKAINIEYVMDEKIMGDKTLNHMGGALSNGVIRLVHFKWKKGAFHVVVSIYQQPGNMPTVTIVSVPTWRRPGRSTRQESREDEYDYDEQSKSGDDGM